MIFFGVELLVCGRCGLPGALGADVCRQNFCKVPRARNLQPPSWRRTHAHSGSFGSQFTKLFIMADPVADAIEKDLREGNVTGLLTRLPRDALIAAICAQFEPAPTRGSGGGGAARQNSDAATRDVLLALHAGLVEMSSYTAALDAFAAGVTRSLAANPKSAVHALCAACGTTKLSGVAEALSGMPTVRALYSMVAGVGSGAGYFRGSIVAGPRTPVAERALIPASTKSALSATPKRKQKAKKPTTASKAPALSDAALEERAAAALAAQRSKAAAPAVTATPPVAAAAAAATNADDDSSSTSSSSSSGSDDSDAAAGAGAGAGGDDSTSSSSSEDEEDEPAAAGAKRGRKDSGDASEAKRARSDEAAPAASPAPATPASQAVTQSAKKRGQVKRGDPDSAMAALAEAVSGTVEPSSTPGAIDVHSGDRLIRITRSDGEPIDAGEWADGRHRRGLVTGIRKVVSSGRSKRINVGHTQLVLRATG